MKKSEGGDVTPGKKPVTIKYGINHITSLVEQKKAQLVVIAHDVDPIEVCVCCMCWCVWTVKNVLLLSCSLLQIVVFLPTLCRKMGVPYCIIKGKARLGTLVHKKTATAIAVTQVKKSASNTHTHAHTHTRTHARSEDKGALNTLLEAVKTNYNERFEDIRKRWGGGIMGRKAQDAKAKQDKIKNREMASKMAA